MQLLRDNLTLWTSSDAVDAETTPAEGAKEEEKAPTAETTTEESEPKAAEPEPEAAS